MRAVCPASMSWMPLAAPVVTNWPRFRGRPDPRRVMRKAREAAARPGQAEGAPRPTSLPSMQRLARRAVMRCDAPVGMARPEDQAGVVAEVGRDHARAQDIDGGQRAAGELDAEMHHVDQGQRLSAGPMELVRGRVLADAQDKFGLDRGKAADKDGKLNLLARLTQAGGENGAGQAIGSENVAQWRRNRADLAK